jgi:hypothetical protein
MNLAELPLFSLNCQQADVPELTTIKNYQITEVIGTGSAKEKVKRNLKAIELLAALEETGKIPNLEEKGVLAQYMDSD